MGKGRNISFRKVKWSRWQGPPRRFGWNGMAHVCDALDVQKDLVAGALDALHGHESGFLSFGLEHKTSQLLCQFFAHRGEMRANDRRSTPP